MRILIGESNFSGPNSIAELAGVRHQLGARDFLLPLAKILAGFEINNIAGAPLSALSHNPDRVQCTLARVRVARSPLP